MQSWLSRNQTGLLVGCLVTLHLGAAGYRVYWIIKHPTSVGFNAPPDPILKSARPLGR